MNVLDELFPSRRLRADNKRLRLLLEDALRLIEEARCDAHSPWCNGVHEGSACEGEYLTWRFVEQLERELGLEHLRARELRSAAPPPRPTGRSDAG